MYMYTHTDTANYNRIEDLRGRTTWPRFSPAFAWNDLASLRLTLPHLDSLGLTWIHLDHLDSLNLSRNHMDSFGFT